MFVFSKVLWALFPWNTGFEIHPFALLPTNCSNDRSNGISQGSSRKTSRNTSGN